MTVVHIDYADFYSLGFQIRIIVDYIIDNIDLHQRPKMIYLTTRMPQMMVCSKGILRSALVG